MLAYANAAPPSGCDRSVGGVHGTMDAQHPIIEHYFFRGGR